VYTCSDGKHLSVGAIEPQFWKNFCELVGLPQHAGSQLDDAAQDQVRADVAAALAAKTRDEWVALLGPADTCVAPVNTVAEAVTDEQYAARGLVADAVSDTDGPFRQAAPVWAGTTPPDGAYRVRDGQLTDTTDLLVAAGLDPSAVQALVDEGAVA
jgi:crotonobetainyl-CoA:carnitine CoA-transferase CaiB-like acyl-CoA transferase